MVLYTATPVAVVEVKVYKFSPTLACIRGARFWCAFALAAVASCG